MKIKFCILLILLATINNLQSQSILGVVLDNKTQIPLESVAVYYDNTMQGVITNSEGNFEIPFIAELKTPLVFSFLGYKKLILTDYEPNKSYKILLVEDVSSLDEVVITSKDDWTRAYKMDQFKQQFLGFSEHAKSCTIQNEDDIRLRFNKKKKQLVATAKTPIIVHNKNLNYLIKYDLQDFIIDYQMITIFKPGFRKKKEIINSPTSVYYSGTSLFEDLTPVTKNVSINARLNSFNGSVVHFMRALAKKSLEIEGYTIVSGGFKVNPDNYIRVVQTPIPTVVEVYLLKELTIVYGEQQSTIKSLTEKFRIDGLGNHSPIEDIVFGGHFGMQRIGDLLPLDFYIEIN